MMKIKGTFFDGQSARAHEAVLHGDDKTLRIADETGRSLFSSRAILSDMVIVPKLGATRRVIRFGKGRQFETRDFKAVEALEKRLGVNRTFKIVDFLETRWQAVVVCFLGLILFVYASFVWGLPQVARMVAFKIPADAMDSISQDALALFDQRFFTPSQLPENDKNRIREAFWQLVQDTGENRSFSLKFRKSKAIGANAFALPSGIIIVTDDLVKTSRDIREIEGVLVHEISHVTHRHAVRSIIQNTGVVVLISMLAGDVTSITSLAASIPTLLLESGYSRAFEIEADQAVATYFRQKGWPLTPYEEILIRIIKDDPPSGLTGLLSTHPDLKERIERLQSYGQSAE